MSKRRGSNAERELANELYSKGFAVLRVAGSGAAQYPTPDLLVLNDCRTVALECKMRKTPYLYLRDSDIQTLKEFQELADCQAFFAVKFLRRGWHFYPIQEILEKGKPYKLTLKDSKITLNDFLNKEKQEGL